MFDFGSSEVAAYQKLLAVAAGLAAVGACQQQSTTSIIGEVDCDLDRTLLVSTVPPNAIWAISRPLIAEADASEADYLLDSDRVLGVYINGVARAYPHNILWHHEIVNDTVGGEWVSVTFCPLTGSGVAFDPILNGARLDLGVSGLLFANNLVLYDRTSTDVYGPQLNVEAACQAYLGNELPLTAVQEMSWGRWKELHPNTSVVTDENGPAFNYRVYPYGAYDELLNEDLLFPMNVDDSRPIKERVLGVRVGQGGRGYPYGELAEIGEVVALNEIVGGVPTVVFYEVTNGASALAFDARVAGQTLTFDADPSGVWVDQETGSTWTFDGAAIAGPLDGERLTTRPDAYTLFWFAWRQFQPSGSTFEN